MEQVLDELVQIVESARTLPMSASAVVHRDEVLGRLQQLRELVPAAVDDAQQLLGDRDGVVEEGRREVERLRSEALAERARLVEKESVLREARSEAERLLASAREQADAMRDEVEDYVDGKLANFEVVLAKTLAAVEKGRARLSGSSEMDDLRS